MTTRRRRYGRFLWAGGLAATLLGSVLTPATSSAAAAEKRPTWLIAHRVLTTQSVDTAIRHGAHALEIDAQAWDGSFLCNYRGWYADHDGICTSVGDPMQKMFDHISRKPAIKWIWLDIKNPDYRASGRSSMSALISMARTTLEPKGVRVLYQLAGYEGGTGWKQLVRDGERDAGLTNKEAVVIDGTYEQVDEKYGKFGKSIPKSKRVMSSGITCQVRPDTSRALAQGAAARQRGEYRRVFTWTAAYEFPCPPGNDRRAGELLERQPDGIIYGRPANEYADKPSTRDLYRDLHGMVTKNPVARPATAADLPF